MWNITLFIALSKKLGSKLSEDFLTVDVPFKDAAFEDSKSKVILTSLAISPKSSGVFPASEYVLILVAIVLIWRELEAG